MFKTFSFDSKVIVVKEEQDKYIKELKEESAKRELEEANQENIKKIRLEQKVSI